jgi:hypothetical protein
MFIGHVLRKASLPSFIHGDPALFSMHCSTVFILILADATDECCLLRAGSTMTLKEI